MILIKIQNRQKELDEFGSVVLALVVVEHDSIQVIGARGVIEGLGVSGHHLHLSCIAQHLLDDGVADEAPRLVVVDVGLIGLSVD